MHFVVRNRNPVRTHSAGKLSFPAGQTVEVRERSMRPVHRDVALLMGDLEVHAVEGDDRAYVNEFDLIGFFAEAG